MIVFVTKISLAKDLLVFLIVLRYYVQQSTQIKSFNSDHFLTNLQNYERLLPYQANFFIILCFFTLPMMLDCSKFAIIFLYTTSG